MCFLVLKINLTPISSTTDVCPVNERLLVSFVNIVHMKRSNYGG